MTVLHGYIDDSGDGDLFTLSCLHGDIGTWFWLEQDWQAMLEKLNGNLKKDGRPKISRYHAADCNALRKEFAGWTLNEQKDLTSSMLSIFKKNALHIISYSITLSQLQQVIPKTKKNPRGFAHVLLLQSLMQEIGEFTLRKYKDAIIGLTHDRCDYDAALKDAFNQMLDDPGFKYRDRFTTITSAGWEDCIPLQAADLFAYENFKEGVRRREMSRRKRRYPLRSLLDMSQSIGGRALNFNIAGLRALKKMVNALDDETRQILYATARINVRPKNQTKKEGPVTA
jgi:hypothetical protein